MADSHDSHGVPANPNEAPAHLEVRFQFTNLQVAFCVALGLVAIVGGLVLGLTITNS